MISTSHGTNRAAFNAGDWTLFLSLSAIWGASFLFMAMGLDAFHPGLVTLMRVGFGALTIALIPRARKTKIAKEDLGKIVFLGFLWIALPLTLFPIAQQWIDSAVAGMLNGATPIFTALLAAILLRQAPRYVQIVGLLLGFAGMIAIAVPSAGDSATATIGVVLVLIATVCYAVALNMVAPLQHRYGSLAVISRVLWVGALMVVPYGVYG
ncbi:MAG: DMT family transporter, partial [Acidimicrobiia bacterium]